MAPKPSRRRGFWLTLVQQGAVASDALWVRVTIVRLSLSVRLWAWIMETWFPAVVQCEIGITCGNRSDSESLEAPQSLPLPLPLASV